MTDNRPFILSNEQGAGTNNTIGLDGRLFSSSYANNQRVFDGGTLIIGQEQDIMNTPSSFFDQQQLEGDFAELIVCSKRLDPVLVNKIRSYLAIKHGIFLDHNYIASDGSMIWDKTAGNNGDYDKNIAGIGRDDDLQLDHYKSRSQDTNAIVTMHNTGAYANDLSFLLWGSSLLAPGGGVAEYDSISTTDAPSDFTLSERRWKVSNPGNRVKAVDVYMDIPPSMVGGNLVGVRLVVSGTDVFAGNTLYTESGTPNLTTGEIRFENITFLDGQYFTIGFDQDLSFTNNDPGAPNNFEACAGSNVTFRYDTLTGQPTVVRFNSNNPNRFTDVPVTAINTGASSTMAGRVKGEITLAIPPDAITGNVLFLSGANVIYNSNAFITIHNPKINFLPETNPVCADRDIRLFGFPAGGEFYSVTPGLISPTFDSLYGGGAPWGTAHQDSLVVNVTYSYKAEYSNGSRCLVAKEITEPITIRDNRLKALTYTTLVKVPGPMISL